MPKNKTHSGTKKRVKVTGSGKLLAQAADLHLQRLATHRSRRHVGQQLGFLSAVSPR